MLIILFLKMLADLTRLIIAKFSAFLATKTQEAMEDKVGRIKG